MKRVLSIFLAAALVLLTLAGCGAAPKAKEKVRLCEVTHSVFYAPQYAAIHLGFFDDAGIEIDGRRPLGQHGHRLCRAGGFHLCLQ